MAMQNVEGHFGFSAETTISVNPSCPLHSDHSDDHQHFSQSNSRLPIETNGHADFDNVSPFDSRFDGLRPAFFLRTNLRLSKGVIKSG